MIGSACPFSRKHQNHSDFPELKKRGTRLGDKTLVPEVGPL